jgi:hypothetical protein
MPASSCKHNKQTYQCGLCYEEREALGLPTPGWHPRCGKLFKDCKCPLNEALLKLVVNWFTTKQKKTLGKEEKRVDYEFYTFMLNEINDIEHSIKLDDRSDKLTTRWYNVLMTDDKQCKVAKFDKTDRLDLCLKLKMITKKQYSELYVEHKKSVIKKQEPIVEKQNENVVDNGGISHQIMLPVAETIDSWLKNINLLQYCAGIKAYGFTDLAEFQYQKEEDIEAMMIDPDVNMNNKMHRRLFMRQWKELIRFGKLDSDNKRTFEQVAQSLTNQQVDTKKIKLIQSFDVNGTIDTNRKNPIAADSVSGDVDIKNCNTLDVNFENESENNSDNDFSDDSENTVDLNVDNVDDDTPLIHPPDFTEESLAKLPFTNETVIEIQKSLATLPFANETVIEIPKLPTGMDKVLIEYEQQGLNTGKVTVEDIKYYLVQEHPKHPGFYTWQHSPALWQDIDETKIYSLSEVGNKLYLFNFDQWQDSRRKRIQDEEDKRKLLKQPDPEYYTRLEEKNKIALDYIRTYTPEFDTYNQMFLTDMSIARHSNIQKQHLLVLRFRFVAKKYEIELRPENNDDKNTRYVLNNSTNSTNNILDGGSDLPENQRVSFEFKHLDRDCDICTIKYKLKKHTQKSANFKLDRSAMFRPTILTTFSQNRRIVYDEERYEIKFMQAKQDVFLEKLICWFPEAEHFKKMDQSVQEDQKDHEYLIMACVHKNPEKYVPTIELRETMDLFRKQHEEKPSL